MSAIIRILSSTGAKWAVSLAVTALCAMVLIGIVDDGVLGILRGIDPMFTALGFGSIIAAQFLRSARLMVLVSGRLLPSYAMYQVSVLHSFLASMLPARIGETSLMIMLRRRYDMPLLSGAGVLLGVRLFDLLIVIAVGGWAGWLAVPADSAAAALRSPALAVGAVATAALFTVPVLGLLRAGAGRSARPTGRLAGLWHDLMAAYAGCGSRGLTLLLAYSLLIWLALYIAYLFCAWAVSPTGSVIDILFAASAGSLAFVLPINGIAQIGPFEAAWASAGAVTQIGYTTALVAGATVHVVGIAAGAVQAAFVMLRRGGKSDSSTHQSDSADR